MGSTTERGNTAAVVAAGASDCAAIHRASPANGGEIKALLAAAIGGSANPLAGQAASTSATTINAANLNTPLQ
jgi:hypothetical protein